MPIFIFVVGVIAGSWGTTWVNEHFPSTRPTYEPVVEQPKATVGNKVDKIIKTITE